VDAAKVDMLLLLKRSNGGRRPPVRGGART
jgi:hypothetical protein